MDRYEEAGRLVTNFIESGFRFHPVADKQPRLCEEFQSEFGYDALKNTPKEKILKKIFHSDGEENSMLYLMEYKDKYIDLGSIKGGSPNKYPVYMNKGKWYTGVLKNKRERSFEEASDISADVADKLITALDIVERSKFETVQDYIQFEKKLREKIDRFAGYAWVRKYLYMNYPEVFVPFYNDEWIRKAVMCFLVKPEETFYGRVGQLIKMVETTEYDVIHFTQTIYKIFGCMIDVHFYRIDACFEGKSYAAEWKKDGYIALPSKEVRSLDSCYEKVMEGKDNVVKSLIEQYGHDDRSAKRLANQYDAFFKARNEHWAVDVFVIFEGKMLVGLADHVGNYKYMATKDTPHVRQVNWVADLDKGSMMPNAVEGFGELCTEIKDEDNLLYLYEKYFYDNNKLGIK